MNKRVCKQLRKFQQGIELRLEREQRNGADDGQPVLRGTGAMYEIADRVRAVAAGGVALMQSVAQALGLDDEIDRRVHLLKLHAPYHESDHVLNIAFNTLAGGENWNTWSCFGTTRTTIDMLGARRIPDPTTAGDFCRRFDALVAGARTARMPSTSHDSASGACSRTSSSSMQSWTSTAPSLKPVTARKARTSTTRESSAINRSRSPCRTRRKFCFSRTVRDPVHRTKELRAARQGG